MRASLGMLGDRPCLWLLDAKGEARASLAVLADGSPSLWLSDADGKTRAHLGMDADGSSYIEICDKDGKTRAALGVTNLEVTKTGATEKTAPSSLVLFDRDGKVIWSAPK